MKRILIIAFIIVIAGTMAYYYFSGGKISFTSDVPEFRAIPIDAPLFIEFSSIKNVPTDNQVLAVLNNSGFLNSFIGLISEIDTLVKNSKELGPAVLNSQFVVALNLEGKSEITPLFITKAESAKKKRELAYIVSLMFPEGKYQEKVRQYNGEKVNECNSPGNSFVYTFSHGLFIASPRATIVEKSIRQLGSESLPDNEIFSKAHKTATQQANASVYVNHSFFPGILKLWANTETTKVLNEFNEEVKVNHKNNVKGFASYCEWSELDLTIKPDELRLNGISFAPDSLNQYLTILQGQEPVKTKIEKVLPRNTALFFNLAFSNKEVFFEKLEEYFSHSPGFYKRAERIKRIKSAARADLQPVLEEIADDEIAMAFSDITSEPGKKNVFFTMSVKAASDATARLEDWLKKYAGRKKIPFSKLNSSYSVDPETSYTIYKFPYPSFPGVWLGQPFTQAKANFFTFWDNYLIFSDTQPALEKLLHSLTLEACLAKNANYLSFKNKSGNKSNIYFFLNINNAYYLNKEYFNEGVKKLFADNEGQLRKFSTLGWQVINSDGLLFNSINLGYYGQVFEDAKTAWQSNIGADVYLKPQLVENHYDPDNLEIIIQDKNNKLCLVNKEGRVKWGISIGGEIMGKIHQVDYLRNGKLQYLFNTRDKFYLIDREGNNVSPFPVSLRSPATNGVNVFDYDNNRKYRYFVAGEDKKIYCYDRSANIVAGWKFGQTDHKVTTPVQHFRVNDKDYIVFKDKAKIYVQDRQGRTRLDLQVSFENSRNPVYLNADGKTKMVASNIDGNVYYLYFDGTYNMAKTQGFSENHFFNVADINGDGNPEFIFADQKKLTVINEAGKKIFNNKFKNEIIYQPDIYTFSQSVKKIGVVSQEENRIYLFNPNGSLHKGFPLQGNSRFTIGVITKGSNSFNLIVGSENGNIYNYRLD